jgi:hypothetical protein
MKKGVLYLSHSLYCILFINIGFAQVNKSIAIKPMLGIQWEGAADYVKGSKKQDKFSLSPISIEEFWGIAVDYKTGKHIHSFMVHSYEMNYWASKIKTLSGAGQSITNFGFSSTQFSYLYKRRFFERSQVQFLKPTVGVGAGFAINRSVDFYDSSMVYPRGATVVVFGEEITRVVNIAQRNQLLSPMAIIYAGFDFSNKKGKKFLEVGVQFNKGFGSLIKMSASGQSGTVTQGYIAEYSYEAVSRGTTLAVYAAVPITLFRWGINKK